MFGKGREEELRDLLQGEFAVVDLAYNEATRERDGLIVASLKSGSLCKVVLEKMMKEYARFDNQSSENYLKEYNLDREKLSVTIFSRLMIWLPFIGDIFLKG